jgi:hypothetical protein
MVCEIDLDGSAQANYFLYKRKFCDTQIYRRRFLGDHAMKKLTPKDLREIRERGGPKTLDGEPQKSLLIDLLVPADRAEDMLGELQKAYKERWVPKYGERRARRILMMHSIGSIIGFWINWMVKHLSLLKFFASSRPDD